jgi:hypothetical protein
MSDTPLPLRRPRWVVNCRGCFKAFVHSYIGQNRNLEDYLRPTDPVFPAKGVQLECPKCKTRAVYHSTDLRYVAR